MKKTYDLIVIDPPWPIKKLTHRQRPNQVNFDYKTLNMEQIKTMAIPDISSSKCICFLWCTQKTLFAAKEILEYWGFKYLLTMVWEKTYGKSAGMPLFGFRWNAEFILVGVKTKLELWPKKSLIPCVFQAPNISHSTKPDRFYELIGGLGSSRIDIFARKQRDGWDVWGNEVESPSDISLLA